MKTSFNLRGGGDAACTFLTLALVAALSISVGLAATTYYLIRTGHSGNDVVQTVPEGGSTTFKIKFQARHIPHANWEENVTPQSRCFHIVERLLPGCYVLRESSDPNSSYYRIRPVIEITAPTEAAAHGWSLSDTGYPVSATATWDHEGHQIEIYQYGHSVDVTATATNDTCKGPQTSTFTAKIMDANNSNEVLLQKTYTLRKRDNDPVAVSCS